uniref:Uncharacterized protein n=1 Tax=Avena sativa TaxID=4498 RepID=A0ACD5XXG0_AVESA
MVTTMVPPPNNLVCAALLVPAAVLYLVAVTVTRRRRRRSGLPPGPMGLPVVGSLPFIDLNLHTYFAGLAAKHGPILSIQLGSKLDIVVSSPELAREVLRDQDAAFANRVMPDAGNALSFGGEENILGSPVGPTWRLQRRLCVHEMLSPAGLAAVHGLRMREFRSTLRYLHASATSARPVDVGAQMFLNTMNVITGAMWGGTVCSDAERATVGAEFRGLVDELTAMLGTPNLSDLFPALAPLDLQGIRGKMEGIRARFDQMLTRIIQQRQREQQEEGAGAADDFLERMLRMEKEGGDGKTAFTMDHVKSMLLEMVVGGTETTSTTVEWAMAEVMHSPEVLRKVRQELDTVVGRDAVVEESHLPHLHYLRMVIKETLRLHPPLPLLVPHSPSATSTVGGYSVPEGSRVFINVWAIHRNPLVWNEPVEFNPERFAAGKEGDGGKKWDFTSGKQFDYMPFGSGRRICAGIAMADKMTAYSLAMLLQAFDWKLPEGTQLDLADKFGIVMKKATPLVTIPTPRLSNPDLYHS